MNFSYLLVIHCLALISGAVIANGWSPNSRRQPRIWPRTILRLSWPRSIVPREERTLAADSRSEDIPHWRSSGRENSRRITTDPEKPQESPSTWRVRWDVKLIQIHSLQYINLTLSYGQATVMHFSLAQSFIHRHSLKFCSILLLNLWTFLLLIKC